MSRTSIESHRTLRRIVFPMLIMIPIAAVYCLWKISFPYDRVLALTQRMERVQKKKNSKVELFRIYESRDKIFIPIRELPQEDRDQWAKWAKKYGEGESIVLTDVVGVLITNQNSLIKLRLLFINGIDAKGEKHQYAVSTNDSTNPPYQDPAAYLTLMEQKIRAIESELNISVNTWFPLTEFIFLLITAVAIVVYFIVVK